MNSLFLMIDSSIVSTRFLDKKTESDYLHVCQHCLNFGWELDHLRFQFFFFISYCDFLSKIITVN